MQDFRKHYDKPDFLPLESETSQQDWFFMGGSGPGAPVHVSFTFKPWSTSSKCQVADIVPPNKKWGAGKIFHLSF